MPVWRVSKCDVAIFFHKIQVCSFENKTEQRKKTKKHKTIVTCNVQAWAQER